MQVTELSAEGLRREYQVTVPAAELAVQKEAKLKAVGQRAKVPGFRPGKIPTKILEQRYGQSVMGELLEEAVNRSSQKLMQEKGYRLATQPKFEVVSFDAGKDLQYKVTLELFPEIPEMDFADLKIERLAYSIDDKELTEGLERIAQHNRDNQPVEKPRKAKQGDIAVIDFLGKLDGVPFDGGKGEQFHLELGSGSFIPGFEEQIEGMKPGEEKTITVTFPADYHSEQLKGKETTFDVTLHELREVKTPDVDEDFAKKLGFDSLEKLKEAVTERMRKDYDVLVRNELKRELFDALEPKCDFPLPQTMVEQEFQSVWEKVSRAKAQGDASLDKPEDELKAEYRKVAERRVKLGLLLAEVSNKNNLQITQDDVRKAVFEQARMFPGQEEKVLQFYQQHPDQLQQLTGPLLEEKAVDFVLTKVSFKDKNVTTEELVKLTQEEDAPKAAKKAPAKKKAAKAEEDDAAEMAEEKPKAKKAAAKKSA